MVLRSKKRTGADATARSGFLPEALPEAEDDSSPPTKAKRARRNRITRNACRQCRQKKTKCDGQHPTCARCCQTDSCCTYDVSEGVTKMQSLKDQLEDKTKDHERVAALLRVLVEANDQDATELLARLRLSRASGYLDPNLLPEPRTLRGLFSTPHNNAHDYFYNGSTVNQLPLDNDPNFFVSSPEDFNNSFTQRDQINPIEDFDTTSSQTTDSPPSIREMHPCSYTEHSSSSQDSYGRQYDFQAEPPRRMSTMMPSLPYGYATGATDGASFFPPMSPLGPEHRDWTPTVQSGASAYPIPHLAQGWGRQ